MNKEQIIAILEAIINRYNSMKKHETEAEKIDWLLTAWAIAGDAKRLIKLLEEK